MLMVEIYFELLLRINFKDCYVEKITFNNDCNQQNIFICETYGINYQIL